MSRIVSGSNTLDLSEKVSRISGIKLAHKKVVRFPDGEIYVRLEDTDFKDEEVYVIHSLYPDQNENLIELFLTINAVKEAGGRPVAVLPYFAYGRQDRIFLEGEAFSLKTVITILRSLGTERLLTIDAHFRRKAGPFELFGMKGKNLSAAKLIADHVRKKSGNLVVTGPDAGSRDFLEGLEGAVFMKKSKKMLDDSKGRMKYEITTEVPDSLHGKDVLLLDDIISTGKTMVSAARILKEMGCKVYAACTHGTFTEGALKELGKYAEKIVCTDTVESECSKVSVAGIIADNLS